VTLHRFFVPPVTLALANAEVESEPNLNIELEIEGELAHQLTHVLRMSIGHQLILLDGMGQEFLVALTDLGRGGKHPRVKVRLLEKGLARGEPRTHLTLFQGLLKGEKFDYVLQKGTEAGLSAFVPVITERCVSDSASPTKLERWRKIIREAAEQSRRGILPTLAEPVSYSEALRQMATQPLALVAWEDEQTVSLRSVLETETAAAQPPPQLAWLIGPEGGLSQSEIEAARAKNLLSVSLGPRIFRAETAGPIAAALTLYAFGDLDR
jgi:16S rRNA (uracil1498-N3)-methyltransferase